MRSFFSFIFDKKIYMSRFQYLLLLCLLGSCVTKKSNDLQSNVVGNWLLLNMVPESPYVDSSFLPSEDSLTQLYTHKLISLQEEGIFTDIDSFYNQPGKWLVVDNKHLAIAKAGRGFELFVTDFVDYDDEKQLLRLRQKISKGNAIDSVAVIWQLKKIEPDHSSFKLFAGSSHSWRKKTLTPESEAAIQERLSKMLLYYGEYFELISAESDFFVTWRIPLPFRFYAHGVGLKTLDKTPHFETFFYDAADAAKAIHLIENAMRTNTAAYPKRDTYTLEYAAYLKMLAIELKVAKNNAK